jgi:hypothetical protein
MSRPRANSFQTGNSVLSLPVGAKVVILGTENVVQRCPHLVGQVGGIYEIPVHPATWFKIRFDDGRIMTFRPSALQSLEDHKKGIKVPLKKPVKKDPCLTRESTSKAKEEKTVKKSKTLLSDTDPDSWIGMTVFIMGASRGQPDHGVVLRSGNGWVQLKTSHGEIARRAYDLLVAEEEEDSGKRKRQPSSKIRTEDDEDSVSSRKSKQGRCDRRRIPCVSGDENDDYESFSRRRDATASPLMRNSRNPSKLELQIMERSRSLSSLDEDDYGPLKKPCSPLMGSTSGVRGKDPRMSREWVDAKARLVEQYVSTHKERMRERPDLAYYMNQIKGGMVDRKFERQMAQDFMDSVCSECYEELWPGAQFCWNEACSSSPVYYKLPGASGKAPKPTPRWSYSISKCIPDYSNMVTQPVVVIDGNILSPTSLAAATELGSFFGANSEEQIEKNMREAEANLLTQFANSPRNVDTGDDTDETDSSEDDSSDEDQVDPKMDIPRFAAKVASSVSGMELKTKEGSMTHTLGAPRVEKVPDPSAVASYLLDAPVKVVGGNWSEQAGVMNAVSAPSTAPQTPANPHHKAVASVSLSGSQICTAHASPTGSGSSSKAGDVSDFDLKTMESRGAMDSKPDMDDYNLTRNGSESSFGASGMGTTSAEEAETDNDTNAGDSPMLKGIVSEAGTAASSPLILSIKRSRQGRAVQGV